MVSKQCYLDSRAGDERSCSREKEAIQEKDEKITEWSNRTFKRIYCSKERSLRLTCQSSLLKTAVNKANITTKTLKK